LRPSANHYEKTDLELLIEDSTALKTHIDKIQSLSRMCTRSSRKWCHVTGFCAPAQTLTRVILPELQNIAYSRRGIGHVKGFIVLSKLSLNPAPHSAQTLLPVQLSCGEKGIWAYDITKVTPHQQAQIYVVLYLQERGDPDAMHTEKGGLFAL